MVLDIFCIKKSTTENLGANIFGLGDWTELFRPVTGSNNSCSASPVHFKYPCTPKQPPTEFGTHKRQCKSESCSALPPALQASVETAKWVIILQRNCSKLPASILPLLPKRRSFIFSFNFSRWKLITPSHHFISVFLPPLCDGLKGPCPRSPADSRSPPQAPNQTLGSLVWGLKGLTSLF